MGIPRSDCFPGCSQFYLIAFQDVSQISLAMRDLNSQQLNLSLFSFCCSESPHGERALTEDSVQDVTAEHHTSDDGMGGLVFTGVTGAACPGTGRGGCAGLKIQILEFESEHSLKASHGRKYQGAGSVGISGIT